MGGLGFSALLLLAVSAGTEVGTPPCEANIYSARPRLLSLVSGGAISVRGAGFSCIARSTAVLDHPHFATQGIAYRLRARVLNDTHISIRVGLAPRSAEKGERGPHTSAVRLWLGTAQGVGSSVRFGIAFLAVPVEQAFRYGVITHG